MNAPTTQPLSIGVVGCGYWGPNLVRNFDALAQANVQALCDKSEKRLAHMHARFPEAAQFKNFDEMLSKADLDAVAVATPVHTHFKLAKAALLAGKHVLVEKPMASSVAECDELNKIADEKGLTLMVGHTFLYSEPIHRIAEIISMGDIGEVRYINTQRLNLGLFQKDINVAWDLAPHDISIILHVLGQLPESVNCQGNAHITEGIEDVTNISLNFSGKKFATIQSSWLEPRKVRQMTIVGTKRMIVYDDVEPREKLRIYDVRVERPPHYDTFGQFHYSYHYGDSYIPHMHQEEPLKVLAQHFVDCIRKGNRPISCGHRGAELVSILEACSESLAAGGAAIPVTGSGASAETNGSSVQNTSSSEGTIPAS